MSMLMNFTGLFSSTRCLYLQPAGELWGSNESGDRNPFVYGCMWVSVCSWKFRTSLCAQLTSVCTNPFEPNGGGVSVRKCSHVVKMWGHVRLILSPLMPPVSPSLHGGEVTLSDKGLFLSASSRPLGAGLCWREITLCLQIRKTLLFLPYHLLLSPTDCLPSSTIPSLWPSKYFFPPLVRSFFSALCMSLCFPHPLH